VLCTIIAGAKRHRLEPWAYLHDVILKPSIALTPCLFARGRPTGLARRGHPPELWEEAVSRGLGAAPGTFLSLYEANRRSASESELEDSSVAQAILRSMEWITDFGGSGQ
jgi:hypothetical protein